MKLDNSLPPDWRVVTLGDVARVQAGGTPSRDISAYWGGDIAWVGTRSIDFNWIDTPEDFVTEAGIQSSSARVFPAGTILMAMIGQGMTRGKVATLKISAAINQNCVGIVPNGEIDSRFLYHFLVSQYSKIRSFGNAGSVSNMNASMIRSFQVPAPPIDEGRRVGAILDSWDDSHSVHSRLIAAKVRFKRGLMQQLLTGRRRFGSVARSAEMRHTPCGELPNDWPMVPLSCIVRELKRKNCEGVTRVLTASGTRGLVDQREFFNRKVAGESLDKYYLLKRGEFAYNRSLMKGYPYGAIKRLDDYDSGVLSTLYLCFQLASDQCNSDFMVLLFESGLLNSQLRGIARMGGRAHGLLNVTAEEFFDMVVPLPSMKEQQRVVDIFGAINHELDLLGKELNALKSQKKGLMQKLLTGQVRVKVR